jgi:hypothetical protein
MKTRVPLDEGEGFVGEGGERHDLSTDSWFLLRSDDVFGFHLSCAHGFD